MPDIFGHIIFAATTTQPMSTDEEIDARAEELDDFTATVEQFVIDNCPEGWTLKLKDD